MTTSRRGFDLTADQVESLPLDELALQVLTDAKETKERNWKDWVISRQTAYEGRPGAIGALEEAWGWLFTHGLIVNSGLHSSWSIRITRRGEKLLGEGIAWLRATDRLDVSCSRFLS